MHISFANRGIEEIDLSNWITHTPSDRYDNEEEEEEAQEAKEALLLVSSLDLSHNKISKISNLQTLQQLTKLDISHNELKSSSLCKFPPQMIELNLSHNNLESNTYLDFSYLKQLEILDISYNKLHSICVKKQCILPQSIKQLFLSHNKFKQFECTIPLQFLNYLDISYNQLFALEDLRVLASQISTEFQYLVIMGNPLSISPSQYQHLFPSLLEVNHKRLLTHHSSQQQTTNSSFVSSISHVPLTISNSLSTIPQLLPANNNTDDLQSEYLQMRENYRKQMEKKNQISQMNRQLSHDLDEYRVKYETLYKEYSQLQRLLVEERIKREQMEEKRNQLQQQQAQTRNLYIKWKEKIEKEQKDWTNQMEKMRRELHQQSSDISLLLDYILPQLNHIQQHSELYHSIQQLYIYYKGEPANHNHSHLKERRRRSLSASADAKNFAELIHVAGPQANSSTLNWQSSLRSSTPTRSTEKVGTNSIPQSPKVLHSSLNSSAVSLDSASTSDVLKMIELENSKIIEQLTHSIKTKK